MTPFYIIFAIFGLWLGYKAIILMVNSIKAGINQANMLEKEFGTNVWLAARYTMGMPLKKDQDHDHDAND